MIDRRHVLAATVIASGVVSASGNAAPASSAPSGRHAIDPRDHGARFDGVSDDTRAWRAVLAEAATRGLPILCPPGVTCIGDTLTLPRQVVLLGAGCDATMIRVRNSSSVPSLYGLACTSGVRIADLGFQIENRSDPSPGRPRWTAAIGFVTAASDIRFERVAFNGIGGPERAGRFGGYLANADVSDVRFVDCRYEALEIAGVVKGNADHSTQRDWQWSGCRGAACIDGISINSPAGEWSGGRIVDCDFSRCAQFPFSLAGPRCSDWVLDVSGSDNDYELVHIEDGVHDVKIRVRGEGCNRLAGVRGSPASPNGLVQIIGGSYAIAVDFDIDLTRSGPGAPNGLVAQHGGPRVSNGTVEAPHDITVAGRLTVQPGRRAIIASDVSLRFDNLILTNMPSAKKAGAALALSGCRWTGNLSVYDPGDLVEVDPNSAPTGMWDQLNVYYSGEPVPFHWIVGAFPETRNAFPIARSLRIEGRWPVKADGWVNIAAAPTLLDAAVMIKRTGAIQSYALSRLKVRAAAIVSFSDDAVVARDGQTAPPPEPEWRIDHGMLQCRARPTTSAAWRSGAPDSRFLVVIDGLFLPMLGASPTA